MEPVLNQKNWLDAAKLQVIREFFAWILVIYFIYSNKELDKEKTEILKAQIEVLNREKDTQIKLLEITNKMVNDKNNQNNNTTGTVPSP